MLRRIFMAVLPVLAIAAITPIAAASSGYSGEGSEDSGRTRYSTNDDIWRNLCIGASPDSASSCQSQQATSSAGRARDPSPPPNIEAGLCVGASLNLSRASADNCLRKQAAAAKNRQARPTGPPNIETGLCVGASLNLSLSSAARCNKKQAEAKAPTQHKKPRPKYTPNPQPKQSNYGKYPYEEQKEPIKPKQKNTGAHLGQTPKIIPPAASIIQYAALGDSTAAGTGLSTGPNLGDGECGRSAESYPYIVAKERGLGLAHIACSGATMANLLTKQRLKGYSLPAQLDSAYAGGTPQLITITAGANDVRWDSVLIKCTRGRCGTPQDERSAESSIAALQTETQAVLQEIAQRSGGSPPKVIITGYYNPISANCAAAQTRVTAEEIVWIDTKLSKLNDALRNAAGNAPFATFLPINFSGHDICSADPWVQGLNDPSPLHPNAAGQKAIARMIIADP